MLGDISVAKNFYITCGYTDMRKSIDELAAIILQQFKMDPFQSALFLFCGKRCNRIKALLWEKDGFVLPYKRLENGRFRWSRNESDLKVISWQQFRWLMEGEEGKAPQAKSYMWLYKTGNDGKLSITIYDYQHSRNSDHAVKFLKDFSGYVHCDGYSGYNKLSDITRCGCWAHLRRKFIETIPSQKAKDAPLTHAEI